MPCLTMRCADRPASEFPSKVISPADSGTSPDITRSKVVLPAPFGPITPTASCGLTSIETSNKARNEP